MKENFFWNFIEFPSFPNPFSMGRKKKVTKREDIFNFLLFNT